MENSETYAAAVKESQTLEQKLEEPKNHKYYRVLSGDRPTGLLHIGHYFGSLKKRLELQAMGLEMFIIIADYQVLTDRKRGESIDSFVRELCVDYLAVGLDPENYPVHIFCPKPNNRTESIISAIFNFGKSTRIRAQSNYERRIATF